MGFTAHTKQVRYPTFQGPSPVRSTDHRFSIKPIQALIERRSASGPPFHQQRREQGLNQRFELVLCQRLPTPARFLLRNHNVIEVRHGCGIHPHPVVLDQRAHCVQMRLNRQKLDVSSDSGVSSPPDRTAVVP